jgi:ADP-ribose pyrophosphatase YjhB (NUDIX family)
MAELGLPASCASTPISEQLGSPSAASPQALLACTADRYGGLSIDSAALPSSVEAFAAALEASLQAWRQEGKRGIWLSLPLALSSHVPAAAAQGFRFHHSDPSGAVLTMTHWLDPAAPSGLPPAPATAVGVGAFLLSGSRMLVVQERTGPAVGIWKIVTGLVDRGEELGPAVEREVLEETGVRAVFQGVIGVRHANHLPPFDNSDLFFMCAMTLADPAQTALAPCPQEIADAQWMELSDFQQMAHVRDKGTVWGRMHQLCLSASANQQLLIKPETLPLGTRPGSQTVYCAEQPL